MQNSHQVTPFDAPDGGIAEKVDFLRSPAAYPEATARVDVVETHMSWIFLTDRFAYKLKKPVRYEFLDFRSLRNRRRNCEQEVVLNRRLAPAVYLGVVPLTVDRKKGLHLGGTGTTVDWLVKMQRLPRERMLDQVIAEGRIDSELLRRLGQFLAAFYRDAEPIPMAAEAYRRRFAADISENQRHLNDVAYGLPRDIIDNCCNAQTHFIVSRPDMLGRRAEDNHIVEAHGDLRPEHICLGDIPQIIDCLEFKRDFRLMDPVDELSFLALECEYKGAPAVGGLMLEVYREVTGDFPAKELIDFYKSYRACLRAKLAVWHLRDDGQPQPQKWLARARSYLEIARGYAETLD